MLDLPSGDDNYLLVGNLTQVILDLINEASSILCRPVDLATKANSYM